MAALRYNCPLNCSHTLFNREFIMTQLKEGDPELSIAESLKS